MIRTQIFLPEELYQSLKLQALREKKPTAQIIRLALKTGMKQQKQTRASGWDQLINLKAKGPRDLSKNIDKYLYEE